MKRKKKRKGDDDGVICDETGADDWAAIIPSERSNA